MALKRKIDEKTFNALSDELKKEYTKQEDGSYSLETEGDEDTGALKRAKDREKEERRKAEQTARELKEKLDELTNELEELKAAPAKKKGDVDAVEATWKAKLAKREKELNDQIESANNALRTHVLESTSTKIASEIAGENAEVIMPHIQKRLKVEIVDGKIVTKVLGQDGADTELSPADLQKEFLSNNKFSAIVVASKASGGGAGGGRKGGSGAPKKLSEMTATEEAQFANSNPQEYKAMLAKES